MVILPAGRARGFTLVELLIGLAIVAILTGLAAPSFSSLSASMRARSASSELHAALALARSEAIKRNAEVTLSPVTARAWQDGWRIAAPDDAERLLDDHPAVPGAVIAGPASVVYLPNGRVRGATLPSFDIAVGGNDGRRCVAVDLSGRPNQTSARC